MKNPAAGTYSAFAPQPAAGGTIWRLALMLALDAEMPSTSANGVVLPMPTLSPGAPVPRWRI
jgi:hypothetical protein